MTNKNSDDLDIPNFLKRGTDEYHKLLGNSNTFSSNLSVTSVASRGLINPREKEKVRKQSTFVPDVQHFLRQKSSQVVSDIEGMIDDGIIDDEWSMYEYLNKNEYSKQIAQYIHNHWYPIVEELAEVLNTDDEDLLYAYRGYTKDQIRLFATVFLKFIEDCEQYIENTKKVRKIRKKKKRSVEKIVKGINYLQKYEPLRLVSVDPAKVIGSSELWVFNVNSKVLTCFKSIDRGGLNFRGSFIINYDEKTSNSKKIPNKQIENTLKTILESGKLQLRKLLSEIEGPSIEPTRLTKNTIIVRVL